MEQLALEVFDLDGAGSQFAALDSNDSITIIVTSEIFDSGDIWTHNFNLNVYANAHIFGTAGDLHGSRLHEQVNMRRARLWVMGMPMYIGYLRLEDEVEMDSKGDVEVKFESGKQTFKDMIDGGKANQVPLMTDVQFGIALWRKRILNLGLMLKAYAVQENGCHTSVGAVMDKDEFGDENNIVPFVINGNYTPTQKYPRMVYPKGRFYDSSINDYVDENWLNTDFPYTENEDGTPVYPYCNIALCYQKKGYPETEDGGVDYSKSPEVKRGYDVMPANRVNSAPNFYVIYWLRSLMKHLDIYVAENQMLDVEDLCRLFFVNTKCAYEEPEHIATTAPVDPRYGLYQFADGKRYLAEKTKPRGLLNAEESKFEATVLKAECTNRSELSSDPSPIKKVVAWVDGNIPNWSDETRRFYKTVNGCLHKAFATPECFPDEDIDTVIDVLQDAFGIRFLFDNDYKKVRIVLLRNLFRSSDVQELNCDVTEVTKVENNIRGFRLTFGDNKEDTAFYYKGFADVMPRQKEIWVDDSDEHDYSQWSIGTDYKNMLKQISAFNVTCYISTITGNAYGIKIDKEAKRYKELFPSLFEFAGYMDAEDGDCTGEEETIKEIQVGFKPAIMNDVNYDSQRSNDDADRQQKFALFVEEEMAPRRYDMGDLQAPASYNDSDAFYDVDDKLYAKRTIGWVYSNMMVDGVVQPGMFGITSDAMASADKLVVRTKSDTIWWDRTGDGYPHMVAPDGSEWEITFSVDGYLNEGYRLYLQDNFEPNDDGVSPIETHEWGVTLGIMRGSGSDAYVDYSTDPEDGEGNETWDVMPGSSTTAHPDVCDDYGNNFVYRTSSATPVNYSGYQYGDAMLQNAGCQNVCNLKNRRGPEPLGLDVYAFIDSYLTSGGSNLLILTEHGYYAHVCEIEDNTGKSHTLWLCCVMNGSLLPYTMIQTYANYLSNASNVAEIIALDREGYVISGTLVKEMLIAADCLYQPDLLTDVAEAYLKENDTAYQYYDGRFSLKLRTEKPYPFFDPSRPEDKYTNPRYIGSIKPGMMGRGLSDQFYKEYSYWVRNARIARLVVTMDLNELLRLDKTKQVHVIGITGFIKKMQFSISNKTGLSSVEMEIWYL